MKRCFLISLILLLFILSVNDVVAQTTYTVTLKIKDAFCLGGNDGSAKAIVKGDTTSLTYVWSNGQTLQEATGLSAGTYTLTLNNAFNKDTSLFFFVNERSCDPMGATVFTPNGDGISDKWEIAYIELYPDFQLLVYNRWGQKVHEQENNYEKWDGKSLGLPLPDATYYYIIKKNKGIPSEGIVKGSVSIVR